ncbi:nucleoside-diphosphate-sugar epimerase [Flavobacterium sp. 270]|uniref:SDR family oxidoreductase n=1 Tax=Flavobacterium sp. 270 TaxID=2512114 RepID=UPI0010654F95|nr:aldehyde reductase [Flavobacterium sp. 270]TDW51829.1 nucleoside-diphosphate-sugar epimerase [Flavobacterium sp. 270]
MKNQNNEIQVLVTGGTGFVGIHCILQLLEQGYKVKTTLRSLKNQKDVIQMLKNGGISSFENLSFVETNLSSDLNWDEAVKDCDYVLHVASPISLAVPKTDDETIKPAVEGTLRVLKVAKNAGVKRVVLTSSFAAVGYSHNDNERLITEEDWTNPDDKHLSAYLKSKVLAEKAAWDFIQNEGKGLELSVINPMAIFGPLLSDKLSSGHDLLKRLFDGSLKAIPQIALGITDVRDVADLHIRAMLNPKANGQRFLALSGGILTFPEVAMLLKQNLGAQGEKVTTKIAPNWLIRFFALFNAGAKNIVPQLGRRKNASNEKAISVLNWKPRTNEEAIIAAGKSMILYNIVK